MMPEYIEREAAKRVCERYGCTNGSALGRHSGLADCIAEEIESITAADVAPVRHGRWEPVSDDDQDEGQFHCSACGAPDFFPNGVPLSKYCYNCGAKMD